MYDDSYYKIFCIYNDSYYDKFYDKFFKLAFGTCFPINLIFYIRVMPD